MSWGERSCKRPCRSLRCTMETCNVDCLSYVWDGVTEADSYKSKPPKEEPIIEKKLKPWWMKKKGTK